MVTEFTKGLNLTMTRLNSIQTIFKKKEKNHKDEVIIRALGRIVILRVCFENVLFRFLTLTTLMTIIFHKFSIKTMLHHSHKRF